MSTTSKNERSDKPIKTSGSETVASLMPKDQEDLEQPPEVSVLSDVISIFIITLTSASLGYLATTFESHALVQPKMEPWLIARASGITAYILMWLLAMAGIVLSHPLRQKYKFLHPITRMRLHTLLAVFTLSFIALHIMAVILDSYALVGLSGAFIPFASKYRPIPVALGTLGLYAGLLTGIVARFRMNIGKKGWTGIHRFSIISLVLIWIHAVYAGTDSRPLSALYLVSAFLLISLALSRYLASKPAKVIPSR